MPFLQVVTKGGRKYNMETVHSRSSDARDENKVDPSSDFVTFWRSFPLTFDECTSQLPRDAFPGSNNEGETQIGIVHWRSLDTRDDTAIETMMDFVFHASIFEDLKLRAMQSLESVFVRSQCTTEEDLNQLRCQPCNHLPIIHPRFRPTSFSTNYESSTLNFDLNRGRVFWSHRRTSEVGGFRVFYLELTIVIEYSVVVVKARSKEEAICRRGPHKLWLKRATIRLLSYFRRFNRNLREWLLVLF
ncbi:protein artichoke [Vespula squamosa]|uniref:Protein artichoke n=1 Tax=Vespula squamosa TaxID=30214 RepID=A0ABD1ZZL2_VESSQ